MSPKQTPKSVHILLMCAKFPPDFFRSPFAAAGGKKPVRCRAVFSALFEMDFRYVFLGTTLVSLAVLPRRLNRACKDLEEIFPLFFSTSKPKPSSARSFPSPVLRDFLILTQLLLPANGGIEQLSPSPKQFGMSLRRKSLRRQFEV